MIPAPSVTRSQDWDRINTLPVWFPSEGDIAHWREALHLFCREPGGGESLLDLQVLGLAHWAQFGALFGSAPVGTGKTLITLLAPRFFAHRKAVLLLPASLKEKTLREREEYAKRGWRVDQDMEIVTYEQTQTVKSAEYLEALNPDILICDEASAYRKPAAARTKRFLRFCQARPELRLAVLDGNFMRRSLRDFWHLLLMTHGVHAPVPLGPSGATQWGQAIDAGVPDHERVEPGPLVEWCSPEEGHLPARIRGRLGFRNRLAATPGILIGGNVPLLTELVVREKLLPIPSEVKKALNKLYSTWETPNGDWLESGLEVWRHARELLAGFWYKWDPPPPLEWKEARREWHGLVRRTLARDIRGVDSPAKVAQYYRGHPVLATWKQVEPRYKISKTPVWVSDYLVDDAAQWAQSHPKGLIWVSHRAVGERMQATGLPYFGGGAEASRAILSATGPIVVSISAHKRGKNLQRYHQNLIVTPPTTSDDWEQLLGRTYRQGQEELTEAEVYLHEEALCQAMKQALEEAVVASHVQGVTHRLLLAQKHLSSLDGEEKVC